MTTRRHAIAALAVVPLAACALSPTQQTTVADIAKRATAAINFVAPIIPVLALEIPALGPWVPLIQAGLADASTALAGIVPTMTPDAARPIVGRVVDGLGRALDASDKAAALIPVTRTRIAVQATLGEARAVLPILTAFALATDAVVAPKAGRGVPVARVLG
jgi:hypothetical protein